MVQSIFWHRRSRSAAKPRPKHWRLAHGVAFEWSNGKAVDLLHFYIPPDDGWVRCNCGWKPELGPHYAHPDVATTKSWRSDPWRDVVQAAQRRRRAA